MLLVLFATQAYCQKEKFDIITYAPLKGWKKDAKEQIVSFTKLNESTGSFGVIVLYASAASNGDIEKDFSSEWKDLAVDTHQADPNPQAEKETTADGWNAMTAAAPIKLEGVDCYLVLTVFSGFGKRVSVLASLNDSSYLAQFDVFLRNMSIDKKGKMMATNNTVSATTTGAKQKFGSVLYASPAGWQVTKYPDGVIIVPGDTPAGEFIELWVMPSMSFSGTMEQALQKSFDETVVKLQATKMRDVSGGDYSTVAAKKSFRGWEYIRCSGGIRMGSGDYPAEFGLDLFLIKINNRFEQIALIQKRSNCGMSRYYPSNRLNYFNAIEDFLFSLQFEDWKEPIKKPGIAKGEGLAGVWQGITLAVGAPKPGAELGVEYKVRQAIFFSNGQIFFGTKFPTEGLDELNTWVQAEQNRRDWGTYTFNNGKGVITLPYGDIPMRMEKGKLIITTNKTDHGFIKMDPVDGAKLNGTWALSTRNYLGEETGQRRDISFTVDGKFTDNGAMNNLYHEYVECLNNAKQPGSGSYEIKNNSVVFNYTDGRKIKIALTGMEFDRKSQTPAVLTLSSNEDALTRK